MKVCCLSFTYPKDAYKAVIAKALMPPEWQAIWCVESKDANMPVPDGVQMMIEDFPRGAHLNVPESIAGIQRCYLKLAQEYDVIIKMDSDVSLFVPHAFDKPILDSGADFVYVRRTPDECKEGLCNGSIYSMSRKAVNYLRGIDLKPIVQYRDGHEDLTFSHFFRINTPFLNISQLDKFLVDWCVHRYVGKDCIFGHYGYVSVAEMFRRTITMLQLQGRAFSEEQLAYITSYMKVLDSLYQK